jgi:hypothetical protein
MKRDPIAISPGMRDDAAGLNARVTRPATRNAWRGFGWFCSHALPGTLH